MRDTCLTKYVAVLIDKRFREGFRTSRFKYPQIIHFHEVRIDYAYTYLLGKAAAVCLSRVKEAHTALQGRAESA